MADHSSGVGCEALPRFARLTAEGPIHRAVRRSLHRFDSHPIVDGATPALLAAEVSWGRLNRYVPEAKLDLFEFGARGVAEARTSAAQAGRKCVHGNGNGHRHRYRRFALANYDPEQVKYGAYFY